MNIKRYEVRGGRSGLEEAGGPAKTDRQVVLLSDHIASHAYDEAKERELFGKFYCEYYGVGGSVSIKDGLNIWLACAKSRARSAE